MSATCLTSGSQHNLNVPVISSATTKGKYPVPLIVLKNACHEQYQILKVVRRRNCWRRPCVVRRHADYLIRREIFKVSIAIHFGCHRRRFRSPSNIAAVLRLLAVLTFKTGSFVSWYQSVFTSFSGENRTQGRSKVVSFFSFVFLFWSGVTQVDSMSFTNGYAAGSASFVAHVTSCRRSLRLWATGQLPPSHANSQLRQ